MVAVAVPTAGERWERCDERKRNCPGKQKKYLLFSDYLTIFTPVI